MPMAFDPPPNTFKKDAGPSAKSNPSARNLTARVGRGMLYICTSSVQQQVPWLRRARRRRRPTSGSPRAIRSGWVGAKVPASTQGYLR